MVQYYVVRHLHWSFSFAIVAFEEILPEEEWENFMRRAFTDDYETYQFLTDANNN